MLNVVKTIDMQDLRYLNLFGKVTGVNTKYVLRYNEMLVFLVPKMMLKKSLGKDNENLRKMSGIVKKRIRVVALPLSVKDAQSFVSAIIKPVEFSEFEVKDNEIIITAGRENKAALLGRNKRRFLEMQSILKSFFGKDLKIA